MRNETPPTAAAVAAAPSPSRSAQTISFAPSAWKRCASAAPMPPAAPVMTMILPESCIELASPAVLPGGVTRHFGAACGQVEPRCNRKARAMLHVLPVTSPETEAALNQLSMSPESQPLFDAVKRHIAENVEPMAEEFHRLGEGRADRWSWAPGQLELLEIAKNKAKASGLWEFLPARFGNRSRADQPRLRLYRDRAWQAAAGVGNPQLFGARYRQHGGAGTRRHPGPEGAVVEAAAQRRNPIGLCDDRAGRRVVGCQEYLDERGARKWRMGHQRREILYFGRRRPALQDPDLHGAHQPRWPRIRAAIADPGAHGHARREGARAR